MDKDQPTPSTATKRPGSYSDLEVVPPAEGLEATSESTLNTLSSLDNFPEVVPAAHEKEKIPYFLPENQISAQRPPTICGLRRRFFWSVIIAAILVVAIVTAVAVGVTQSKKSRSISDVLPSPSASLSLTTTTPASISSSSPNSRSPSKTNNPSPSSQTTAQDAYPTTPLGLNCPAVNGTSRNATADNDPSKTYTFDILCNYNFGVNQDSSVMNTSSLNDCIQGCVDLVAVGANCVGVVWDSIMNLDLSPPKNCFLKSTQRGLVFNGGSGHDSAAALLQN